MAVKRRLDKNRVTLRKGECYRSDGRYSFRWCTRDGKRHYIYAKTLDELRRKEMELTVDQFDGIRTDKQHTTVNDVFELWCELKRGLKDNTFQNLKKNKVPKEINNSGVDIISISIYELKNVIVIFPFENMELQLIIIKLLE